MTRVLIRDEYPPNLLKITRKCDACPDRFKCYTSNTSQRPEQLAGINFRVADCCLRCKNSVFTRLSEGYRRVGACQIHHVAVHQFSLCGEFIPKKSDTLTGEVYNQIEKEVRLRIHNYGLPRFCIVNKKDVTL